MLKLSLLNGAMPLHQLGKARYQGRTKLRGQWVHRVRIMAEHAEAAEREGTSSPPVPPVASGSANDAPSPLAGRAGVGSALGVPGLAEMALWIGAEDALIYRSDTTFQLGSQTVTLSLLCDDISTARPPAGAFTFEPPPSARPVARFEPPRGAPGAAASAGNQIRTERD